MDDPQQSDGPLSPEERAAVRALLEAEKRAAWLRQNVRTWALWLTSIIAAATIGWDAVKRIIKGVFL